MSNTLFIPYLGHFFVTALKLFSYRKINKYRQMRSLFIWAEGDRSEPTDST